MTLGDINTKITLLTGADTDSYTNAQRLIDINIWQQKVVSMILDSQDESDWDDQRNTDYPILTTSLTTNRDYSIPVAEKVIKVKDVSVSYDGTNFYRATPFDIAEWNMANAPASATTQNATIDSNFDRTVPRYDVKFNSVFLYPKANATDVANGGQIIIEWFRGAPDFTSGELSAGIVIPGFDDAFHAMLAYGPAYEYCQSKNFPQTERVYRELKDFETRLRIQYSSKQLDRKYALGAAVQDYK